MKTGNAGNTATLSRDHTILVSASGLVTITGGKWTTYRKMAEDVIDQAELVAGLEKRACRTQELRIHGWTQATGLAPNLQSYGADAAAIAKLFQAQPALSERLHPALPYQHAEVIWHARHEMARTVEDVLARRSSPACSPRSSSATPHGNKRRSQPTPRSPAVTCSATRRAEVGPVFDWSPAAT